MKRFALLAAFIAAAVTAPSAQAALFVSGDSSFLQLWNSNSNNRTFLQNIVEGTNVLIQSTPFAFENGLAGDYSGEGFNATVLGGTDPVTAEALAGKDLFIGALPQDDFSIAEMAAIATFLNAGGNVLLTGDNVVTSLHNGRVNALLEAIGSGMRIVDGEYDVGFALSPRLVNNSYTAETAGLEIALTSTVTGGTGLYGTRDTPTQPFLAFEDIEFTVPVVPEPASWAMMIAGFGLVGGALRARRRPATAEA